MDSNLPKVIMGVVVSLIILAVGVYAALTVTTNETLNLEKNYSGSFIVSNASANQSLAVVNEGMTSIGVTQHINNDTTLTLTSSDYTYGNKNLVVLKCELFSLNNERFTDTSNQNGSQNGTSTMAQSFEPGIYGPDTQFSPAYVELKLHKVGAGIPSIPLFCNITATNATGFLHPTTTIMSSDSRNGSLIASYPGEWVRFYFNTSVVVLEPGTTYALNLSCNKAVTTSYIRWRNTTNVSGGYSGGKALNFALGGVGWNNASGDRLFNLYAENETNIINVTGIKNTPDLIGINNNIFAILGVVLVIGAIMLIVVLVKKQELF